MITMIKGTSLILAGGKEEAEELQRQYFAHEFAAWESALLDNVRCPTSTIDVWIGGLELLLAHGHPGVDVGRKHPTRSGVGAFHFHMRANPP